MQRQNWKCYHHEFSSREVKAKFEESLRHLQAQWNQDMNKVRRHGKLKLSDSHYKNSIDYLPANMDKSMEFIGLLMNKMTIRDRSPAGKTVPQMRKEIKACLEAEQNMDKLVKQISENDTRASVIERIMQYVPCILHLENRVAIKILTMLLIEGLSNTAAGSIDICSEETIKQREFLFGKSCKIGIKMYQ